ncbi:MAG: hypothetical protein AAB690_02305 [Patescibacteria group bacterium]
MILTIGNSGSYEVEAFSEVVRCLENRGTTALLFKQDRCLEDNSLLFEVVDGRPIFRVVIDGKDYDVDEFTGIWYLKPHLPRELLSHEMVEYRPFIHTQFHALRKALWAVFRNKLWVSDPWAVDMAESKIYQLFLAHQVGFSIPETVITSDPEQVRRFYQRHCGNIVVKIVATSPILDHVIATNRVSEEDMKFIETVREAPAIFQELVPKAYELRITVVRREIFATKIYSQDDEETSLDWRRKPKLNDFDVRMEQVTLPTTIENQIHRLLSLLGLRFGCIDMIVTPEGKYVFLEINPNGH